MQGYLKKTAIFIVNLMVVGLIICGIKEADRKEKFSLESQKSEDLTPVDDDTLELQNKVATDRENKLRDLNNSPKQLEQKDTVTTKTTTTPAPAPKVDKKTKSS